MALRKSIPHFRDLTRDQFHRMFETGIFQAPVTEKPDGFAFEIGWDSEGFYCRSASSPKVRQIGGFTELAVKKFGTSYDPAISRKLDYALILIKQNTRLMDALKSHRFRLTGEMMLNEFAEHNGYEQVKFNNTWYSTEPFGINGAFIIHTEMPHNREFIQIARNADSHVFRILLDALPTMTRFKVDVSRHLKEAGYPDDYRRFDAEAFDKLKQSVEVSLRCAMPLTSKWAESTDLRAEGYVFHSETRFKIMMKKDEVQ